jgi:transcriptional regulator with XRE-family HTH domain
VIQKLYKEVLQVTDNFKILNPEVLKNDPRRLLIFRLLLNMDQRSLASLLDKSQGTIWSIENGYIKNISSADAVKILNATRKIKNIPNETILLNRVSEIAKRGRFHDEYAKKMSKRASKDKSIRSAVLSMPTKQENVLIKA